MPKFLGLPDDDQLWVVKWIDEFSPWHGASRSPSILVRLQLLPFSDPRLLSRLQPHDVARLLGEPANRNRTRLETTGPRFKDCRVHVGALPLITVGRVYKNQEHVGDLPNEARTISLPRAEESCSSVQIGDDLPKPSGWAERYPFRLLSRREYSGLGDPFGRSRCLVYADVEAGITYILPRIAIFKRFYAPHSELAKAFSPGPWGNTKSNVVYEHPMESGLVTQVDPDTGDWHVILQTLIPDAHYLLVALLYFDDFANRCAEHIYTEALRDKKPWYASAQLPFRPHKRPLELSVKGFTLTERWGPGTSTQKSRLLRRTFFVSSIQGATWPTYIPAVCFERFNSGLTGLHSSDVKGDPPPPYSGAKGGQHTAQPGPPIQSHTDASQLRDAYLVDDDTIFWINKPPERKLVKKSSKRYPGGRVPPGEGNEATEAASAGAGTTQKDNPSQIRPDNPVRPPVARYKLLLEALEEKVDSGTLSRHQIVQPIEPFQTEYRGGLRCWNFYTRAESAFGSWPTSGWRILKRAGRGRTGLARSALVIRLEREDVSGIWIEIEARRAESGMASLFVHGMNYDDHDLVAEILETIASSGGANIRGKVGEHFLERADLCFAWYTHVYARDRKALDADSISRFLKRAGW